MSRYGLLGRELLESRYLELQEMLREEEKNEKTDYFVVCIRLRMDAIERELGYKPTAS